MKNKILVVDDDHHIVEIISFALTKANFDVIEAADGNAALDKYKQHNPELIVLDIGMPELDGLEVCKEIKKVSDTPVLFLSAKDDEFDKVLGLEIGADDYVAKPFSPRELVARVKAILRRGSFSAEAPRSGEEINHGHLRINTSTHVVTWLSQPIELTATEFSMLKTMASRPAHVFSREQLMENSYQNNIAVSDRTIDSHLRRIRNKFKEAKGCPIDTVHGVGYRVNSCDTTL
ncbi:MAG: response regulator transcription factor [Gammaproteobacteria bacterium]|nr:response regulator transcription factor [Gammaproteobacteria bacterium]